MFGPATLDAAAPGTMTRRMATRNLMDRESATLSEEQRGCLDRSLRRLHESMRDFWRSWPLARRNASQISRELSIDRTTCQRVAWLTREPYDRGMMLESTPGVRALRGLADAAERVQAPVSATVLAGFRSAVDELDELLRVHGGSLSALKRRLRAGYALEGPEAEGDGTEAQESLFHAARRVTRRHSLATVSVGLYDSVGVTAEQMRHVRISGSHAVTAEPSAVPMVLEAFDTPEAPSKVAGDGWQRVPALLRDFTTVAWRSVQLGGSPGFGSQAVEIGRGEAPGDVFWYTAFPVPEPTTLDDPIEESWFILNAPAAALIFDLYLHESVARRCLVSLDVHLWQASFAHSPHGRWHTRMPQRPPIVQLGRGLQNADCEHYARLRAVTEKLFELADANPDDYIGFRCAERFPIWRTGYRFELDFGRQRAEGA